VQLWAGRNQQKLSQTRQESGNHFQAVEVKWVQAKPGEIQKDPMNINTNKKYSA